MKRKALCFGLSLALALGLVCSSALAEEPDGEAEVTETPATDTTVTGEDSESEPTETAAENGGDETENNAADENTSTDGNAADYNTGYETGYEAGYAAGVDAGYAAGYEAAYQAIQEAAASETDGSAYSQTGSTEYGAQIVLPDILTEDPVEVDVPSIGTVYLNPYGMPVEMDDGTESYDQLVSSPLEIVSYSTVPVDVTVNAVGTAVGAESSVQLVTTPPAEDTLDKEYFVWLEFWGLGYEPSTEGLAWSGVYTDSSNQLVVNSGERTVLTLPAAEDGNPIYGAFRAFGLASVNTQETWNSSDLFEVVLSFTFTQAGVISD